MEKITIKQFVEGYSNLKSVQLRDKYITENLETKDYIPYNLKMAMAQSIVNCSCFDENKNLKISSPTRYLLYIRTLITKYTNLKENSENSSFLEEYDALFSTGLLEKVMSKIPEKELVEFETVVQMTFDDVVKTYTSPNVFISEQINKITSVFSAVLKPLAAQMTETLEKIDEKDSEKLVKKLSGLFKIAK